jgi:DNA-binding Xre family transcriptional regulator
MTNAIFLAQIGKRIKDTRVRKRIPINVLAYCCSLQKAMLNKIESGQINIRLFTLSKICLALEIEISELFI